MPLDSWRPMCLPCSLRTKEEENSMPNRMIREELLTCEKVNELSFGAEIFYRRLMSVADDFGR